VEPDVRNVVLSRFEAQITGALIITSRKATNMPGSLVIRPQLISLAFLDRILDQLISSEIGVAALNPEARETLRSRLKYLMTSEGNRRETAVPMIFLKLMAQRAGTLIKEGQTLEELPNGAYALVDDYVTDLLRKEPSLPAAVTLAGRAAIVCVGSDFAPRPRPLAEYLNAGISETELRRLIEPGLITEVGLISDPSFKFLLDPVAEFLAARALFIALRDGHITHAAFIEKTRILRNRKDDSVLGAVEVQFGRTLGDISAEPFSSTDRPALA
jgi:hypothetical protein